MGGSVSLVGRIRVVVAVTAVVLGCVVAASSVSAGTRAAQATQELTITVSDGTKLACGLVLPGGSPPAGGWPGVLLFHGLGQDHQYMETIANAALAPVGFASLMCDARGPGASGGTFGLARPNEGQDGGDRLNSFAAGRGAWDAGSGALAPPCG